MGKEKSTITLDGVEYNVDDLSENAKLMIDHIVDLDRKLKSMQFNVDQIQVGREAFITMLKKTVEREKAE
ncbi:MAG: hypothetical protein ACO29C_06570 [Fluviibacter sp.]|jgi:hypothetical protein